MYLNHEHFSVWCYLPLKLLIHIEDLKSITNVKLLQVRNMRMPHAFYIHFLHSLSVPLESVLWHTKSMSDSIEFNPYLIQSASPASALSAYVPDEMQERLWYDRERNEVHLHMQCRACVWWCNEVLAGAGSQSVGDRRSHS